jgi:DNA-binding NarL/FixJ family response regulator
MPAAPPAARSVCPGRGSAPAQPAPTVESTAAMCDDPYILMTVLVVDDHATFRASVRRLLELDGFRVVAEAPDARTALQLVRELEPELVLLDVGLPDRSGFDVARELAGGRTRVVLISSRAQADLGGRVRESGALGFISKERLSREAILTLLDRAP